MFAEMCLAVAAFIPDWLRRLWAPAKQLHMQQTTGQVIIDILSPQARPARPVVSTAGVLWKPCPSPAALLDCSSAQSQAPGQPLAGACHAQSCPSNAPDFLEPANACCGSEGSSTWSDSLFDSPSCGSSSSSEGGNDGLRAAGDCPSANSEEEPLLHRAPLTAQEGGGAPCASGCYHTPPRASRVRAFANGFNDLCGGSSGGMSPCGGVGSKSGDRRATLGSPLAAEPKSGTRWPTAWVPPADIDGLMSAVVGTLWQDDE